jgi:hypothetical protein
MLWIPIRVPSVFHPWPKNWVIGLSSFFNENELTPITARLQTDAEAARPLTVDW